MISKGRLRTEKYSMLGKSSSNFSEKSVMSSATKSRDKVIQKFTNNMTDRLSPLNEHVI